MPNQSPFTPEPHRAPDGVSLSCSGPRLHPDHPLGPPRAATPLRPEEVFQWTGKTFHSAISTGARGGIDLDREKFTSISPNTAKLVQLAGLSAAIGKTITSLGESKLLSTLESPPRSLNLILARQEAIHELETSADLRKSIGQFLGALEYYGSLVLDFIDPRTYRRAPTAFKDTRAALDQLVATAAEIPIPSSSYLKILVQALQALPSGYSWRLFHEPFCGVKRRSEPNLPPHLHGGYEVKVARDVPFPSSVLDRYRWPIPPKETAILLATTGALTIPLSIGNSRILGAALVLMMAMVPMLVHAKLKYLDETQFYQPLADALRRDPHFVRFMEAAALLDEASALSTLRDRFDGNGCFPQVSNSPNHFFRGREVHNPFICLRNKLSVANDFVLDSSPWGFTGPNSGGKTTAAITLCQIQVLAQAGARVPAKALELSIADSIFYQAQSFSQLEDQEGRFGTELRESKKILDSCTPASIRIFDELAQGTTKGESEVHAGNILRAHASIGGTTVFITHAHELVSTLAAEGSLVPKQIELRDGLPTHRLIDGISKHSGSELIANRIGMDAAQIRESLIKKGIVIKHQLRDIPPSSEAGE